ncbi:MAG TPA: DMT family transporter, partial [Anaerolineaceae bacterium]|nr:DMT family transporter [Anaerolineaceae bacterium]
WPAIQEAMLPLLFSGVVVAGVAFTFQVLGQRGTNPTLAALIMSLEAVFALIGGILVLNERMSSREWVGSALMLTALIIAQLKFVPHKNKAAD